MADRGHGGSCCVHGGAGYLYRERGPSSHLRNAGSKSRPGNVGTDQLSRSERDHSACGWMGFERHRTEEVFHALHRDLYDCQLFMRHSSNPAVASALPGSAGPGWWRSAAYGAGHYGRLIRTQKTRSGLFTLRPGGGAGTLDRPDAGRLDYRQLLMAMDL